MIESHCNPDEAWSDAQQQITPQRLFVLLEKLVKREVKPEHITLTDLEDLRHKIDKYDQDLLEILGKRMGCAGEIGAYKKKNDMTILQTNRWEEILNSRVTMGEDLGLSNEIVKSIFKVIHQESINTQEVILTR